MGSGHHHHGHHHAPDLLGPQAEAAEAISRIRFAFLLNMIFALVELIGGIMIGSFAIVADSIHDFGDSMSLALALVLQKKSSSGPSPNLSYGYLRYSVLSSIITGIVIISGSIFVFKEAIERLLEPSTLPYTPGMVALGILGVLVNGYAAYKLSHGHSHNEKMLSWHLIEDVLGWVVVLIGAIFIAIYRITWLDPLLAMGISVFVAWNVVRNMREPIRIILQYVPGEADVSQLKSHLATIAGVTEITEIHAWTLDGYSHVLTAHIHVEHAEDCQRVSKEAKAMLKLKGYKFVTLEINAHDHEHAHDKDHDYAHSPVPAQPPC